LLHESKLHRGNKNGFENLNRLITALFISYGTKSSGQSVHGGCWNRTDFSRFSSKHFIQSKYFRMSKEKHLKLIDGTFESKDAFEILMNVYSSKIHFHQLKNIQSQEREGKDCKKSKRRIEELKKSMDKASKVLASAQLKGKRVIMKSEVIISFVEE
jgi:hypothetical protein